MTLLIMLTCDEPDCTKKLWIKEDHSKRRLYEKARKMGWMIDDKMTGKCKCVGHRILLNKGFNNIKKDVKK